MQKDEVNYYPEINQIALFLDIDNIGIRKYKGEISLITNSIKPWGKIAVKIAYGNSISQRANLYQDLLNQHFKIAKPGYTPHKKNGADIQIAMDAIEVLQKNSSINTFAIATGDSDFLALVNKLHDYGKNVIGIGSYRCTSKQLLSQIGRASCRERV